MELFSAVWLCLHLVMAVEGNTEYHAHPLSVSVPYVSYVCPEGANITMVCEQSGALDYPTDRTHFAWLFTPHMSQHCHERLTGRHDNSMVFRAHATSFSVTLLNVTHSNQGRYCCLALDMLYKPHKKPIRQQEAHSHVMLTVTPRHNGTQQCTRLSAPTTTQSSVTAGVATAACIVCILCLPVLLVLVYRQRQTPHSSRRAQELVRMDSEARGHENPVYMGSSPQTPFRTVAQIMTRQTSETGRHLLSDPGTPFSPNTQGEVFFPGHEPIPESPDFQAL